MIVVQRRRNSIVRAGPDRSQFEEAGLENPSRVSEIAMLSVAGAYFPARFRCSETIGCLHVATSPVPHRP